MRNVGVILAREYLQRVRSKAFIFSTIGFPLLMGLFIGIPIVMEARDDASGLAVAVRDETGRLTERIREELSDAGYIVEDLGLGEEERTEAQRRVEEGDLVGIIEVGPETIERGSARLMVSESPSVVRRLLLREAVSQAALVEFLGGADGAESAREILSGSSFEVVRLSEDGPSEDQQQVGLVAGVAGAFILYMVLLIYGTMVLGAVLEEKTSRIVEIIVSSVRPWQLMMGKVLGVGSVGLTQLAIWLAIGTLLVGGAASSALPFIEEDALSSLLEVLPSVWVLVFFLICFVLGFFMFASLFAAIGAMCSTEQEARQAQFPVVMLVIIPIVFLMPILENPESTFAIAASLVPFFSPILMFARVAAGAAALWEALASIVLMTAALFACAWVGGRIYRVGILMQGKRPTLPEIARWVREA